MNPVISNSDYDKLRAALLLVDTYHNASEVHGIICGAICNQLMSRRQVDVNDFVSAMVGINDESRGVFEASIDSLYESTRQSLNDRDSSFSLLLLLLFFPSSRIVVSLVETSDERCCTTSAR